MVITDIEPTPAGPDPRADRQDLFPLPQDLSQVPQVTSPIQGSSRSSLLAVHKVFEKLEPTALVKRYERSAKLEGPFIEPTLPPLTTYFDGDTTPGWTPIAHPEGVLYWVYELRQDDRVTPIYTEAYLYEKHVLEDIEKFREAILGAIRGKADKLPAKWELVLDLADDEGPGERTCYYYFVNPLNRSLFWLHDFNVTPLLHGITPVNSTRRIQQALESCYWHHWEMFPHNREVPEALLKELMGLMTHAKFDVITSRQSVFDFTGEELEDFILGVERLRYVGGVNGYSACVLGRMMRHFATIRYINFFGQREARLSRDQSIFGHTGKKKRTWLIKSISFLLLFSPEVHLEALDSTFSDFIVCQRRWNKFIHNAKNEWRDTCGIGSVVLAANVAFLAIPSVGTTDDRAVGAGIASNTCTPAQVCSYMSVILSLGCLVIGQLLLRHHTVRSQDTTEDADEYLRSHYNPRHGLETLATLYSLPYSLLLWAILSFFAAFAFAVLVDSKSKWERYPTAAATFASVALLTWCIWATCEEKRASIRATDHTRGSLKPGHGGHSPDEGQFMFTQVDPRDTAPTPKVGDSHPPCGDDAL